MVLYTSKNQKVVTENTKVKLVVAGVNAAGAARALKFPVGDPTFAVLADIVTRANKLLGFDALGAPATVEPTLAAGEYNVSADPVAGYLPIYDVLGRVSGYNIVHRVPTLADLAAETISAHRQCFHLMGRNAPGDGGDGLFIWDSSNLSAEVTGDPEHGYYVAVPADPTGVNGALVRRTSEVNARAFETLQGALNWTAANSSALRIDSEWTESGTVNFPSGFYEVRFVGSGKITSTATIGVTIGDVGATVFYGKIFHLNVEKTTYVGGDIGIVYRNIAEAKIVAPRSKGFEKSHSIRPESSSRVAYTDIDAPIGIDHKYGLVIEPQTGCYANENTIEAGRMHVSVAGRLENQILIDNSGGATGADHNRIIGISIEGYSGGGVCGKQAVRVVGTASENVFMYTRAEKYNDGWRDDTTLTGQHDGAEGAAVLTDSSEAWVTDALVGLTIFNSTDGSSGTITANTANTVTATLAGGASNNWSIGDGYYIRINTAYYFGPDTAHNRVLDSRIDASVTDLGHNTYDTPVKGLKLTDQPGSPTHPLITGRRRSAVTVDSKKFAIDLEDEYASSGKVGGWRYKTPIVEGRAGEMVKLETGYGVVFLVDDAGSIFPRDNFAYLGSQAKRYSKGYIFNIYPGNGSSVWTAGNGSPEGVLTAVVGSLYTRLDGSAGSTLYVKESGAGNTGWVSK